MHSTDIPADLRILIRTLRKERASLPVGDQFNSERRDRVEQMLKVLEAKHERLTGNRDYKTPDAWRTDKYAVAA